MSFFYPHQAPGWNYTLAVMGTGAVFQTLFLFIMATWKKSCWMPSTNLDGAAPGAPTVTGGRKRVHRSAGRPGRSRRGCKRLPSLGPVLPRQRALCLQVGGSDRGLPVWCWAPASACRRRGIRAQLRRWRDALALVWPQVLAGALGPWRLAPACGVLLLLVERRLTCCVFPKPTSLTDPTRY